MLCFGLSCGHVSLLRGLMLLLFSCPHLLTQPLSCLRLQVGFLTVAPLWGCGYTFTLMSLLTPPYHPTVSGSKGQVSHSSTVVSSFTGGVSNGCAPLRLWTSSEAVGYRVRLLGVGCEHQAYYACITFRASLSTARRRPCSLPRRPRASLSLCASVS